jgi:uncharacterized RDD family membrane protein YckC
MIIPASPWKRLVAFVIDNLVSLVLGLVLFFQVTTTTDIPTIMTRIAYLIGFLILGNTLIGLLNIYLTSILGGSMGKLLTGIMVVNKENKQISFWRAMFRNYMGYTVSGMLVWLGFLWAWKDHEHRAWHDMLADTYVVTKNDTGVLIGIVVMLGLMMAGGYETNLSINMIKGHLPVYREIFTDVVNEFSPTPTPAMVSTLKHTSYPELTEADFPVNWVVNDAGIKSGERNFQTFLTAGDPTKNSEQVQFSLQIAWTGTLNTSDLKAFENQTINNLTVSNPGYIFTEYAPPQLISISGKDGVKYQIGYHKAGSTKQFVKVDNIINGGDQLFSFSATYQQGDMETEEQVSKIFDSIKISGAN